MRLLATFQSEVGNCTKAQVFEDLTREFGQFVVMYFNDLGIASKRYSDRFDSVRLALDTASFTVRNEVLDHD